MRIIAKKAIIDFYTLHSGAKIPLEDWYKKAISAEWSCFADIKNDFNSVDAVGNGRFVFNIKGNHFRLVVLILFVPKIVYIRFIGTHKEYDKIEKINNRLKQAAKNCSKTESLSTCSESTGC